MKDISTSIPKKDADDKISGRALYVDDYPFDDLYHAKMLRSTKAKAKIKNIHIPELPDDYFIVDRFDVPHSNVVKMIFEDWPVFANDIVNYIGEPILIVCGRDKTIIDLILAQIVVEYEELEPIFNYVKSVIHKSFVKGDPKNAFQEASQTIEYTYETGYQEQAYIEPQGFVAYLEDDGKMTLIGSMQCPYYVKNAVIQTLGCQDHEVRVIQPAVGGAFGGKEEFPSVMACQLAVAVKKIKHPVKMIYEREEDMLVTTKRHPSKIIMKASLDMLNHITGIKAHVSLDSGAYIGLSGVVLSRAMIAVTDAYTIHHLDVTGDVYETNTVPNGAFRGFGAPQMIFAMEMFMQHIAKKININPYTFRLEHLAKQGDLTSTSGIFRDPILMKQMIEKAMEISGYPDKYEKYEHHMNHKGIGMSWFLHGCGFTGSGESKHINAKVKLRKDDRDHVYLLVAAVDMGQGAKTSLAKIVASTLELPISDVNFDNPDTDFILDSGPTVASRTTMIVGGLLARAAKKMKDTWKSHEEMIVIEKYEQPSYINWDEDTLHGDAYPAYSWGVNIVEVEVSPITYQVTIKGIWSVYDIGKTIDERMALGQADGGITQGIAYGYLEVMEHKNGRIRQKNMTDYIIPTSVDMAPTETIFMDNPYALGPYGAKGIGELTLVGGAPAVALAIEQAIQKNIHKIPATPEYIMELMNHEHN
jgi:CO/xanthine dehydrogenase Mo-binding subunit